MTKRPDDNFKHIGAAAHTVTQNIILRQLDEIIAVLDRGGSYVERIAGSARDLRGNLVRYFAHLG